MEEKCVAELKEDASSKNKLYYRKYTLDASTCYKWDKVEIWRVGNDSNTFYKLRKNIGKKLKLEPLSTKEVRKCLNKLTHSPSLSFDFETRNNKSYAIMYSGGYDSTALAIRHLEKGENVYLFGIQFDYGPTLLAAITTMVLKAIYGKDRVAGLSLMADPLYRMECDYEGLQQQPFSAFYAAMVPSNVKDVVEAVECGFIMNDDAMSYVDELRALYDARMAFYRRDKSPKLDFPSRYYKHWENVDLLREIESDKRVILPVIGTEGPEIFVSKENNNLWIFCDAYAQSDHENKQGGDGFGYVIRIKNFFEAYEEDSIYSKLSLLKGYGTPDKEEQEYNKNKALGALTELMEEGILTNDDLKAQLNKNIKEKKAYGRLERRR